MTASDLAFTSAAELARMIRAKQISATEVMRATLKRAQDVQAACNCFITICAEQALGDAAAADKAIAKRRRDRAAARRAVPRQGHGQHQGRAHHVRLLHATSTTCRRRMRSRWRG